jgi:hypothetical protein
MESHLFKDFDAFAASVRGVEATICFKTRFAVLGQFCVLTRFFARDWFTAAPDNVRLAERVCTSAPASEREAHRYRIV